MTNFTENEPDNFRVLSQLNPVLAETKGFVAGGAFKNIFTGTPVKDVDVFFRTEEDWVDADETYKRLDRELVYENDKVRAYRHNGVRVELIKHIFGTPEEVIDQFDFTITKFAYGFKYRQFDPLIGGIVNEDEVEVPPPFVIHHKDFFEHMAMKRLVIDNQLVLPVNTWERSYKYHAQGYNMCRDSKVALLQAILETQGRAEPTELAALLTQSLYAGID